MEGMPNWIVTSVELFVICLLIFVQYIYAQTGFVSLACCSPSTFTDTNNITWTSDDSLFPDNKTCQKITGGSINYKTYDRVRVFNINLGKRCYSLPTTEGKDYLVRGTFLSGNIPVGSLGSFFDVSVGVTPIGRVNSSDDNLEVEGIFAANNQRIDFCLVHQKGDPYISQLELRPLDDQDYLQGQPSSFLKLVSRVDAGNIGDAIRYPADPFDRIWRSPDPGTVSESKIFADNVFYNVTTTVPLKVLQTALTHTDRLEFRHSDLDTSDSKYTVFLYFLELNQTIQQGQRVFDIYINDKKQQGDFDILAGGSNYSKRAFSVTANGFLNLTLVKVQNGFPYGPLLNAYEVLQVQQQVHRTNQHDVNMMAKVRFELLQNNNENEALQSWSGDPCLPVPWTRVACQPVNGSPAITVLNISASQFRGPLPVSVTQLTYLIELNVSNNDFTGKIPQFPASSMLSIVDLSHNDLMGFLPKSLTSLPHLTTLYFGCNRHLSQDVPTNSNGSRLTTDSGSCVQRGPRSKTNGIVIGTIACGSFLFTLAVGIFLVCFFRRKMPAQGKLCGKKHIITKNLVFSLPSTEDVVIKSINIQMFSLEYIENATDKYKNLIGEGGFGSVYRGTLPDGQEVAVKVRSSTSTQGTREFDNELTLLSAIRHENLVPLLGYCCENDQQILVYPFMSNGSLQDRLYGEAAKRKTLDWPTRLSIALGAARGLTHLHTFAGRCIIHRDVKSSNILLDHSMTAKVADFGFSKYAPQEGDSGASLEVRGTAGYLDPEYYSTQHLSAKSDVFSFGVVLLEIVSGREPLNVHRPRNEWSLVEWAKHFIRESRIDEIVDPSIKGGYHAEAMWRVVEVALSCIETFSAYRPCMADIVRELEDALIIENNASEYMKSIDSIGGYSLGGSSRFSIVMDKKNNINLQPPPSTPTPTEPSPINLQTLTPPGPR